MPHDPARVADTAPWISKAKQDLRAAEFELTAKPPLAADIVFHCQQAAEKAMKGYLTWHDRPFRKTHDLVEIGQQVADLEPELEPLLRRAAALTEYAWKFRYPGDPEEPTQEEADEALAIAREVFDAILARLPNEIRP
jgi:HEPN domain-containing protein